MAEIEFNRAVPVLIGKIGNYPLHHGTVGAIRSLGRAGIPVYTITEDLYTPAACSRWLAGHFVWQNAALGVDRLLEGFEAIANHIGRRPVLLPTDDQTAIFISANAQRLEAKFRFPRQRTSLIGEVINKVGLYRICSQFGVASPQLFVATDRSDAISFCSTARFPVIAKIAEGREAARAGIEPTTKIDSPEHLIALWDRAERSECCSLTFQEYIPDGEDWIFHGYCDERSTAIAAYTGLKIRSYPPFTGMTALARVQNNDVLVAEVRRLLINLGYRGMVDMDWRFDRRDGRYKLLDFNPRIGAQFRMFVDERGIDVARALHLDMTGRPVPHGHVADGRVFMVEHFDLLAALGGYRRAGLTFKEWRKSLRGIDELGWFSADDLVPALALSARSTYRLVDRLVCRGMRLMMPSALGYLSRSKFSKRSRNWPLYWPGRRPEVIRSLRRSAEVADPNPRIGGAARRVR